MRDKTETIATILWVIIVLLNIALVGGAGYVAIHFIMKFW